MRRRPSLLALALLAGAFTAPGCLKSLDESLIPDESTSGGTGGSAGSAATGGGAGSGGSAGGDASIDSGGTSGTAGDAGLDVVEEDSGHVPVIVPYDASKFPITQIANASTETPLILAADGDTVYRTSRRVDASVSKLPIEPPSGSQGLYSPIEEPTSLSARSDDLRVYVAGGAKINDSGKITGVLKDATQVTIDVTGVTFETAQAIHVSTGLDHYAYVVCDGKAAGNPQVMRFRSNDATPVLETIVSSPGNELGKDVTTGNSCVYWIATATGSPPKSRLWVAPTTPGSARASALETPVDDVVAVSADLQNFYYARANGEIWQRALIGAACDGTGAPEQRIASGFQSVTDVFAVNGKVAWVARGSSSAAFADSGIFSTQAGGGDVTTLTPPPSLADGGYDLVEVASHTANFVVYATTSGILKKVPKP